MRPFEECLNSIRIEREKIKNAIKIIKVEVNISFKLRNSNNPPRVYGNKGIAHSKENIKKQLKGES